tara:strand:+ start:1066 stop:2343 length:1278 start_codon:yes stop_codon:yes gene_type:complete
MESKLTLHKEDYLPHQWDFITSKKPINALVGGFGSGKTFAFLHKTFINHVTKFNEKGFTNGWVIYPTYELAEELFVEPMKEIFERNGISYKYNVQKHKFTTNYGVMKIYQLQKPQRIIGAELTFIGFDEFDVESWKNCDIAYKKAIGRMRGSDNCEVYIVTTPEGFKYTHHQFVENGNDSKALIHGKTTDNHFLPDSYINLLEANYDKAMLEAYRDGQFVNISALSTYHSFERSKNVGECNYDRSLPVRIGLDWNVDPMCAVLFHTYPNEPKVKIFDAIALSHQGQGDLLSARMCATIREKYPNNNYICYPDASGFQRHTSAMYSDIDILKQHGFKVKVRKSNPPVVNRVNSVNKMLEGNNIKPNILIDPRCKALIQDLEKVTNKQGTRDIDKSNKLLTHMSDALGYAIEWEFPIIKPTLGAIER